jgi:hypothetical protein
MLGGSVNAIAEVKQKLAKYPHMRYVETSQSIEIPPENSDGFAVALSESDGQFTVNFDGWHEVFASDSEALNCFAFGLSESCRLRVAYRGYMPVSWAVESLSDGKWLSDSETGLILVPIWRKKTIRHLQNHWLPASGVNRRQDGES